METIVVLNAGSSSIKFSLFAVQGDDLLLENRGQIEGIYTSPHFIAKDKSGAVLAEKRCSTVARSTRWWPGPTPTARPPCPPV
mgnify:CR=1 FL=1